jgi:hypothetical protein
MPDKGKGGKRDESYFASGRKKRRKWIMIVAPAIAVILAASAVAAVTYRPTPVQAIDGIPCNTTEFLNFHYHSHLDLLVDTASVPVPALIGIPNNQCFYWLHTHTTDGIIHEESPSNMTFTLGQFLDIWDQTQHDSYNATGITSKPVVAYVNGVKSNQDYRSIPLQSREEIALVIGTPPPPASIPSKFPSGPNTPPQ